MFRRKYAIKRGFAGLVINRFIQDAKEKRGKRIWKHSPQET